MDSTVQEIANYLVDSYSLPYLIAYAQDLGIPDLAIMPPDQVPLEIAAVLADYGYTRATLPLTPRGFYPQFAQVPGIGGQSGDSQSSGSPGQYGSDGVSGGRPAGVSGGRPAGVSGGRPAGVSGGRPTGIGPSGVFGSTRGILAYTDMLGYTVPQLPTSQETDYSVPFLGPPQLANDLPPPEPTSLRPKPYYRQPPLGHDLSTDDGEQTQQWKGNFSNRYGAATSTYGLRGEVMTPQGRVSDRYSPIYTITGLPAGGGASQYGGTYGGSSGFDGLGPMRQPARGRAYPQARRYNGLGSQLGPIRSSSPLYPYVPRVPLPQPPPLPELVTQLPGSTDPYMEELRHIHNSRPWEADGLAGQVYPGSISVGDEAARWRDVERNRASMGDAWNHAIIGEPYTPYNGRAPKTCGCQHRRKK
jgi:hypothetical protein